MSTLYPSVQQEMLKHKVLIFHIPLFVLGSSLKGGHTWERLGGHSDLRSSLLAQFNSFVSPRNKTWHLLTYQEGILGAEIEKANLKIWLARSREMPKSVVPGLLYTREKSDTCSLSRSFKYVITSYCPEVPAQFMDIMDLFWGQIRFID